MNMIRTFLGTRQYATIIFIITIGFVISLASPGLLKAADREDRITKLEFELERAKAVNEIANISSKYQYYMWARMHDEQAQLFALKTPGVKAQLASMGIFEGASGIQKMHAHMASIEGDGTGVMIVNMLTTPMIVVAGDGKTAKGIWLAPGILTNVEGGKASGSWRWVRYGADFIKENGKWKIWHLHAYGWFRTSYDKNWAEVEEMGGMPPGGEGGRGGPGGPGEGQGGPPPEGGRGGPGGPGGGDDMSANRQAIYTWDYSPDVKTENIPVPPEPYETWDDSMSYVQ